MEFFETVITDEAKRRVQECLDSGFISEGKLVKEFEQAIEEKFSMKNCVAVNSGTAALHLALVLAGVGPGDEVILPAQTFVATGLAVLYCGAKCVFADIDRTTGQLSVDGLRSKITDKTKALIVVAWGGSFGPLITYRKFCEEFNLTLIQDNAQALGATYLGHSLSDFSDTSCYSFQAIKHLTTGDGGMLCIASGLDEFIARRLRWFGISKEFDNPDETGERKYDLWEVGYKYHMNDIQAAMGLGNLKGFNDRFRKRTRVADLYHDNLPEEVLVSRQATGANWLYNILVDNRKDFMRMMKEKDIPVSVVHVGIDRNKVFGGLQDLPNQRYWDEHHVCLPIHSSLTDEDTQKVIEAINGGW